ncbi:histone chaperone domain CHZ-domain-containing protein [Aspergillus pseudotamarii]|uniref:Histone chaperone domain CHZ-domain-containing protein n=1 Tax=Aspergillus pseudotamarii TaxID=132259 RepID=A0A5N6SHE2_ASPPS|nr:histone chaperone domain CHZ-domain-containing protein [Aspergillus pseudotamarii]KAE8134055.1 histone chaperone domain CHZ-domain-containing protein [Aspergillus pseudotamarii]
MDNNNLATTLSNDPAVNAPNIATLGSGKGKTTQGFDEMDVSMGENESDESENEDIMEEEDEDDKDNLEPISDKNIITGGRRTRGKVIDFKDAAEKLQDDEGEDDEDDEDFEPEIKNDNMRD